MHKNIMGQIFVNDKHKQHRIYISH